MNCTRPYKVNVIMQLIRKLAVVIAAMASMSIAQADPILVTVTGTIMDLVDPTDRLGYGGTGDGHVATMYFMYDPDTAAPDVFGGARAPLEADYFTDGNNITTPSWISSHIVFDNGERYSPDDYIGNFANRDQVKIIEKDAGSPYDYYGIFDENLDQGLIGGNLGAVIFEYDENLVNGIELEQFLTWSGDLTDYPMSRGRFVFVDATQNWEFRGNLVISSLTVREIPEPGTLALITLGLLGIGLTRKR